MRNIVNLLWHPGFNNSLDAGDFLHGSHYTEELVDTYLQLNKKRTDLGITFQDDLQFTKHLADKIKKPNSMLGLINSSFQYIDNEMLILLYLYISTKLSSVHMWSMPYGSSVWSPFKLCDIKLIEGVQRRATRTVKRPSEWTIQHQTHHLGPTNTSIQKR